MSWQIASLLCGIRTKSRRACMVEWDCADAIAAASIIKHSGADILSRVRTEEVEATSNTN